MSDETSTPANKPKGLGVRGWVNSFFTEEDDKTPDGVMILWVVGVLFFLGLTTWTVIKSHAFDMSAFGVGFTGVMGSGAGAKWMKAKGNF